MNLQIFSDIHTDFLKDKKKLWDVVTPKAPIAIVAGDIDAKEFEVTVTEIASKFEKVFLCYGNHEWYHKDIEWRPDMSLIPKNVTILDRTSEEYQGVLFLGCTLWTDFKNKDWVVMRSANDGINDFHVIRANNGGTRFTAEMAYEKHLHDKSWLKTMIEQNRGKDIVIVTHFMPSYQCVHDMWKGSGNDMLNHYFSANCDDLLEMCEAKAWVNGHSHNKNWEMKLGSTTIWANPLGYHLGKEQTKMGDKYQDLVITI